MKKNLLKQEVEELTQLLREASEWKDLRRAVIDEGLPIDRVLLAGFHEDEVGHEFGALVNAERVFEFERSSEPGTRGFLKFERVRSVGSVAKTFPAVWAALEIAESASTRTMRRPRSR